MKTMIFVFVAGLLSFAAGPASAAWCNLDQPHPYRCDQGDTVYGEGSGGGGGNDGNDGNDGNGGGGGGSGGNDGGRSDHGKGDHSAGQGGGHEDEKGSNK